MPSSTLALLKRTLREVKRQPQSQPQQPGQSHQPNGNTPDGDNDSSNSRRNSSGGGGKGGDGDERSSTYNRSGPGGAAPTTLLSKVTAVGTAAASTRSTETISATTIATTRTHTTSAATTATTTGHSVGGGGGSILEMTDESAVLVDDNGTEVAVGAPPSSGIQLRGRRFSSKLQGLMNRTRGFTRGNGERPKLDNLLQQTKQNNSNNHLTSSTSSTTNTITPPVSSSPPPQALYTTPRSPLSPLGSPRSPFNANKPLPCTPPPGSPQTRDPPIKPVLKIDRIMATLRMDDIEKLFSGAPQYFSRSEGHFTGAPHPSVAFPFDEELEIRDLTDHTQIEDEAWRCVTAWPHIIRGRRRPSEKVKAHFYPRCRERPNMLSVQGLEKGSLGYQAALELSVADAVQEEQFGFSTLGTKPQAIVEARQRLLNSRADLRRISEAAILEQLSRTTERYQEDSRRTPGIASTLYNELFLKLLYPPTRVIDREDPFGLTVQIQALVKVLAAPNVWIDFSHVEWRIRLGQLLWGLQQGDDGVEGGIEINDAESREVQMEERYWLLLQILLACELLVRLDAITEGDEVGLESIRPAEVRYFEKNANTSVKWSLLLARAWLENIVITKTGKDAPSQQLHLAPPPPTGWLASLASKMALSHDHENGKEPKEQPVFEIRGKHGERQVDGLTHFARKLRWPDIDSYEARIWRSAYSTRGDDAPALTTSPGVMDPENAKGGYFDSGLNTPKSMSSSSGKAAKAQVQHSNQRRRKISAALHPSGWISKSYVSGLMLPGENLGHFLMATLLENDSHAMEKLGSVANLCEGFVYRGKSFWSTRCIVGRVLGAGRGAVECMGWISSDIVPEGMGDGWINIECQEVEDDIKRRGRKGRVWDKKNLETDSHVLGDADTNNVFPADFILPFENIYIQPAPKTMHIEFTALNLFAPVDSVDTAAPKDQPQRLSDDSNGNGNKTPPEIHNYPAAMSFRVSQDDDEAVDMTFSLAKEIYFVTAHPCVSSHHVRIMKSPSSPTIQHIDVSGGLPTSSTVGSRPSSSTAITGHPLHKYYTYTAIHLSELLARRTDSLDDLIEKTEVQRPTLSPTQNRGPKVLVVDCITGFRPQPLAHEMPDSPVLTRKMSYGFPPVPSTPLSQQRNNSGSNSWSNNDLNGGNGNGNGAVNCTPSGVSPRTPPSQTVLGLGTMGLGMGVDVGGKMHVESRKRQFGSDMEVLVRAFCAERGWNALVSRRRRGCVGCAIREAGALGWRVVVRVD